jgi:hypothetical protein
MQEQLKDLIELIKSKNHGSINWFILTKK